MAQYGHISVCAGARNSLDLLQLIRLVPEAPALDAKSAHLYLLSAPFAALGGLSPREKEIAKTQVPLNKRYFRKQAGLTNRWQFPFSLSCDLLGIAQANKAVRVGLNETLMRIMSADTPVSRNAERKTWKEITDIRKESRGLSVQFPTAKPKLRHRLFSDQRAPHEMLFSYTQKVTEGLEPDVTLECLGFQWDLHRIYLFKSQVLADLLAAAVSDHAVYCTDNKTSKETRRYKHCPLAGWKDKKLCEKKQKLPKVNLVLDINNLEVTRYAFAVALKNLYDSELEVNEEDVLGILATASVLQFPSLFQKCVQVMRSSISPVNVCSYYSAACKHKQPSLISDCERWVEVNLVPQLGSQIHLRKLPLELLQKVLKSSRLFTFSEFHLLRITLCWVYLQQNPKIQIIPSYDTVLTYFSSLPKICSFLEKEIGQRYIAIFQSLRLHGITSSEHLEELWQINFLPLPWLTRILSDHYYALENGGDMAFQRDFNTQAVRFGLVLTQFMVVEKVQHLSGSSLLQTHFLSTLIKRNKKHDFIWKVSDFKWAFIPVGIIQPNEPRYHAEIISIYGFFFEIKAIKHDASAYSFYMQRVKHADPIISFCTAECSPVSLKQEREVKYEIKAQCQIDGKWQEFTTDRLTQKFGVKKPSCKSKVLKVYAPSVPIYVTFSLLFPSSLG